MEQLKVITHNLPPIVRDPLIALIGQECYTTLIYNLDLSSTQCIKLTISKGLGLGIVLGGAIVKVPQIIKIVSNKSAKGLSLSSYVLDTASLGITVAYNLRNGFPWSTYGENVFLLAQNVVITILITAFSSSSFRLPILASLLILSVASSYYLSNLATIPTLQFLAASCIPLSLLSKVPQILTNFRNSSTGQLSAFLVFNSLIGCLARVFTTMTETGDNVLWWGFVLAAGLNAVLALQMAAYWSEDEKKLPGAVKEKRALSAAAGGGSGKETRIEVNEKEKLAAPAAGTNSPLRPSSPSTTPKRYVRKLD
ncbi:mannose-P-dolichol utilization defect 1 protein [Meredithblackwellia eburnea MCA 4105]